MEKNMAEELIKYHQTKKLSKRTYVNCFDGGSTYCIEMQVCVDVA